MASNLRKIMFLLAIGLMLPVAAQEAATTTTETTATAAQTTTAAAAETAVPSPQGAEHAREDLNGILRDLPPQVAKALKLDPSLWTNDIYLAKYPTLKAFAAQHPDVAYHSNFYLRDVWIPNDPTPRTPAMEMWDQMLEIIGIFFLVVIFLGAFLWLVKTILDYRRWSRLTKINTEVHTKLLDRFGTNEELMAYMKTEPGKRFLDAAPIAVDSAGPLPRPVSAPIGRVLWSIQIGVVLAATGIGFALLSWTLTMREVAEPFSALGTLGLAIGLGFVAAGVISFILSRKLGLLQLPANLSDTNAEVTNQ